MNAEIITIGDEILIGQIVDTNSAFIAKELNKIGVDIYQITSIQDRAKHILTALRSASEHAELVIITGGLGPTNDDITKKTLCEYFDDEWVTDEKVLAQVEKIFEKYTENPISEMNRRQAVIPSKAFALNNAYGTAPGMWFDENGVVYVSLPGVPFEMKSLLIEQVIPKIQQRFERPSIVHKTVMTYGMGESTIAEKISAWEANLPNFIKLAYLPDLGRVRLRLSARGKNKTKLESEINRQIQALYPLIGKQIQGIEDQKTLEEQIAAQLKERKKTLAVAESCSGGQIAARFTAHAGASAYFKGGVVAYATSSKIELLHISKKIIAEHSVVSAETAREMASQVKKLFDADYAIATTGNAGPEKGDSAAEIGTVFIAVATPEKIKVNEFNFGNHREKVIGKTVNKALELLWEELCKA